MRQNNSSQSETPLPLKTRSLQNYLNYNSNETRDHLQNQCLPGNSVQPSEEQGERFSQSGPSTQPHSPLHTGLPGRHFLMCWIKTPSPRSLSSPGHQVHLPVMFHELRARRGRNRGEGRARRKEEKRERQGWEWRGIMREEGKFRQLSSERDT